MADVVTAGLSHSIKDCCKLADKTNHDGIKFYQREYTHLAQKSVAMFENFSNVFEFTSFWKNDQPESPAHYGLNCLCNFLSTYQRETLPLPSSIIYFRSRDGGQLSIIIFLFQWAYASNASSRSKIVLSVKHYNHIFKIKSS